MNKTVAIIAARKGSRRLPNKHVIPFGDSNILVHKIRQLKDVAGISEIVVSSDSQEMLDMAKAEGVTTHVRAAEYCDEKTKNYGEVVAYLASQFKADSILWAPCVCPLVDAAIYTDAIKTYNELVIDKKLYDGVISVKEFKEFLWDEHAPLNYGLGVKGHRQSQNLPDWHVVINAFFLAPRESMIDWQFHYGKNPYRFIIPKEKSVDIDDAVDFEIAKALLHFTA